MIAKIGVVMLWILLSVLPEDDASRGSYRLFDFGSGPASEGWFAIDDVVMGGVSASRLDRTQRGTAVFTGRVSLENNGGFASIRSATRSTDLRRYDGLALRVRGDGRRYKINLKTDRRFDGLLYRASFDAPADEWRTIRVPFRELLPTFRGRVVPDAPPLDLSRVESFGLMISDGQAGSFRLEIEWIDAYGRNVEER